MISIKEEEKLAMQLRQFDFSCRLLFERPHTCTIYIVITIIVGVIVVVVLLIVSYTY